MKHKLTLGIISTFALLLTASSSVSALEATVNTKASLGADVQEKVQALRSEVKDGKGEMFEDIKAKIQAMRVDVKAMRDAGATPEEIKVKVEEVRLMNQKDREVFRNELEAKRKTLKDEIKNAIDTFKEGKKVKLNATAKTEVKQRLDSAFVKLNDAISGLTNFDKKLSAEILRRKEAGADVSEVNASLELARRSLEETKVSVQAVDTAIEASIDSETGASKEAIKAVINTALESIKTTKSKYRDVLKFLPKAEIKASAEAEVK